MALTTQGLVGRILFTNEEKIEQGLAGKIYFPDLPAPPSDLILTCGV